MSAYGFELLVLLFFAVLAVTFVLLWLRPDIILFGFGCVMITACPFLFFGYAESVFQQDFAVSIGIGGFTLIGLGRICSYLMGVRAETGATVGQLRAAAGLVVSSRRADSIRIHDFPAHQDWSGKVIVRSSSGDFHFGTKAEAKRQMPYAPNNAKPNALDVTPQRP